MKDNFSSAFESKVLKALTELASKIAEDARLNASTKGLPDEIQDAIDVGTAQSSGDGKYSISVRVDLNTAPMARAYEFGSGLHRTKGTPDTYPIEAKDKFLTFPFTLTFMPGSKFAGMKGYNNWKLQRELRDTGQVSGLTYWFNVDHPGVEARPYLTPALKDNIKLITFNLSRSFLGTIQEITPKVVIIKKET